MGQSINSGRIGTGTVTVSSGNVTASIAGSLPAPSATQTIIQKANGKTGVTLTAGTGLTVHTVTAGKTFYLTQMTLGHESAAYRRFELRDNGSGGNVIWSGGSYGQNNDPIVVNFPSPLKFTAGNAVWFDINSTATNLFNWSISGWEE